MIRDLSRVVDCTTVLEIGGDSGAGIPDSEQGHPGRMRLMAAPREAG
jgi:hypothetical protein